MNPNFVNLIRLLACVLTLVAVFGQKYLPKKTFEIYPRGANVYSLYADDVNSKVEWIDKENQHWKCTLNKISEQTVCGISIDFSFIPYQPINAESYDALEIKLDYTGNAEKLRVFARNYNAAYANLHEIEKSKFQFVNLRTRDFSLPITINFNEFSVADWWKDQFDISRDYSSTEFTGLVSFGIDQAMPLALGEHEYHLQSMKLIGDWIKPETLYIGLILGWMAILGIETLNRLYQLKIRSIRDEVRLKELEQESDKYKELSNTDELTGIPNRVGLKQKLAEIDSRQSDLSNYSLSVIDIDDFKKINDKFGHNDGDIVLRTVARTLVNSVRSDDFVARWGGEEFIVLTKLSRPGSEQNLAEKIRSHIENLTFDTENSIRVTASLGVAVAHKDESFEELFSRADQYLYKAKHQGKNCVIYS